MLTCVVHVCGAAQFDVSSVLVAAWKCREADCCHPVQVATKEKNAAEERMAIVQARLDEMQAQFDAAMAQKQLLEDDAAACQKKMDSAAALLHALAGGCGSCSADSHVGKQC